MLGATAAAWALLANPERKPAEPLIHDQLTAYSQVLPIFLLIFAIDSQGPEDAGLMQGNRAAGL